ncbi:unnamed protein product [marine sediment metagenome]|uniref:Uncharacterized protein n=1 Tax=marine sediment metagenome TaxID=412755 RepID=X0XJF6_9ZZZZ
MKVTQIITESPRMLIINLKVAFCSPSMKFNKFDKNIGYKLKITNPKDPIK